MEPPASTILSVLARRSLRKSLTRMFDDSDPPRFIKVRSLLSLWLTHRYGQLPTMLPLILYDISSNVGCWSGNTAKTRQVNLTLIDVLRVTLE